MKKFQVGDRVFDTFFGWTTISKIEKEEEYPIVTEDYSTYTMEGYNDKDDKYPSLLRYNPFEEIKIKRLENLKKGDRVFVIPYGYTTVTAIDEGAEYPLIVDHESYSIEGKVNCADAVPLLFIENPFKREEKKCDTTLPEIAQKLINLTALENQAREELKRIQDEINAVHIL